MAATLRRTEPAADRRPRILVVRRDNIGDLVCTLPFLRALRVAHPRAWIGVLANSYNAAVLDRNPDVDAVIAYRKLKHRGEAGLLSLALDRLRMLRELRALRLDDVVLATPDYQPRTVALARRMRPQRVVGFVAGASAAGVDVPVPLASAERLHEVERVMLLGAAFGVRPEPLPARIFPAEEALIRVRGALARRHRDVERPIVGVHISARKSSQRWPAERFAALMRTLHDRHGAGFMLFWSPGAADNPTHPGDDAKAQEVHARLVGVPCMRWPTAALPDLVAGLAECDRLICADGGAMHLAAALGKPMVCLFGDSDARRWAPWGVTHELLQAPSRSVEDLEVGAVAEAYRMLSARLAAAGAG